MRNHGPYKLNSETIRDADPENDEIVTEYSELLFIYELRYVTEISNLLRLQLCWNGKTNELLNRILPK